MNAKGRLIAVLTDFGTGDPYVAAIKGVIHSILPGALIVDISHGIPRHDVTSAAYTLLSVEPYYPERTIFVCVVDPGVGTGRRIICLVKGNRLFIAPDNGLLNYLASGAPAERWYALRSPRRGAVVSQTFHGRDIFAPAAAKIAGGAPLRSLAGRIPPLPPRELFTRLPAHLPAVAKGRVLHVDHFGNIITNIMMPPWRPEKLSVGLGRRRIRRIGTNYETEPAGLPFIIRGSTGLLEIAVKRGDAARALGVKPGDGVTLTCRKN